MRDTGWLLTTTFALALLCTRATAAQAAPAPRPSQTGTLLVRFNAEAVDGVDELVVEGTNTRIEHVEWQPIQGLHVESLASTASVGSGRVAVRAKTGRPNVVVVQQPTPENEHVLRVRIDDGPNGGAAALSFELWAVPFEPVAHPFDVVVITIDSLRPDHLGCYGYARATSPNLDAFAKDGVRFENAFSTSSFTPPSHASLLTSQQVGDHGLLTWNALADSKLTLPEVLAAHGYRTGASVNLTLLTENNLGQGVEWQREGEREARAIVDDALEFIRNPEDRPFFLWLHLYDVHRPYGRVPGWSERFAPKPRAGIGNDEDDYNLKPEQVRERGLTPHDLAWIVDRYDAGIAWADAQLGPLIAELSTPKRRAHTLIVITADHGESLLEHEERRFSHDPFLYSAVTHVPMLLRYPTEVAGGAASGVVRADLASLIDIAPTVLATLGVSPPASFAGRSLRELEAGAHWPERELYQECWGWERLAAVRTPSLLVLRDLKQQSTRVFDLAQDASELHPLSGDALRASTQLTAKLDAFVARRPVAEQQTPLDPELRRRLERLGYTEGDH